MLCRNFDFHCLQLEKIPYYLIIVKIFNSRVNIKESSVAKLGSVCRRVYRIFSHAYYHHQNIYNKFEVMYLIFNK